MLSSRIDEAFLFHASDILADTNKGLSGREIAKYFREFAVKFKRNVPFVDHNLAIDGVKYVKRTALKMNLDKFEDGEQYYIIKTLCSLPDFNPNHDVQKLHLDLIKGFPDLNYVEPEDEKLDFEIINQAKHWLQNYPDALKLYNEAMEKYALKTFQRNILDDLRVSLELLLRQIFGNHAPLEKQLSSVGPLIKNAGGNQDFINMFQTLTSYFAKYQNNYVKHDDKVNTLELEFIVELASILMKAFVKFASK